MREGIVAKLNGSAWSGYSFLDVLAWQKKARPPVSLPDHFAVKNIIAYIYFFKYFNKLKHCVINYCNYILGN
jgi:hypothetical protein